MSMKVELTDLETKAAEHGAGYLLTSGAGGGPHAMHLVFALDTSDGSVSATCTVGRTANANIEINPAVTLLWPPVQSGAHSLIADGQARCDAEGHAVITLTGAVLHRPAE